MLYYAKNEEKLLFDVSFQNTKDTALVRFTTGTTAEQKPLVEKVHAALIEKLSQHQDDLVNKENSRINSQIKSLGAVIDSMAGKLTSGDGATLSTAIQSKSALETALQNLTDLEVIASARQSIEKNRT